MTELSLILPCSNEADRLPATLATHLAHLSREPGAVEILVIDDGITDATAEAAKADAAGDARVRVLRVQPNHGKGFAVRTGLLAAAGELLVFTDADGAYVRKASAGWSRSFTRPVAIGTRGRTPPRRWSAGWPAAP